MAIPVDSGKHKVSTSHDLVARTSQCVAVGMVDSIQDLSGIAHIHFNNDHERILYSLIEELMCIDSHQANYKIGVSGGVDAFVPGYGFIPGRATADRVIVYLIKNGFEDTFNKGVIDIHTDYIRKLIAYTSKRDMQINRLRTK